MPFPNKETQFPPGQSGNPNGRPKRRALTDRFADYIEGSTLVSRGKNGTIKTTELPDGVTVADLIMVAWARKAMNGDAAARKDALERLEGKVPDPEPPQKETYDDIPDDEPNVEPRDDPAQEGVSG